MGELQVYYRQASNIRRNLVGNKIVDHSDVVGASPVGAGPRDRLSNLYVYMNISNLRGITETVGKP